VKNDARHKKEQRFDNLSDVEVYDILRRDRANEGAFRELYTRLSGRINAYCRCVAWRREESDDLFQEAFTRLYESAIEGREVKNVAGYLIKIARNLWLNIQRHRRPTVDIEHSGLALHDTPHEQTEMLNLIQMAMELLSEDQREAFFLREFADMPYEEIASLLGISSGNVRIRVSRARERIRKILEPYIIEFQTSKL